MLRSLIVSPDYSPHPWSFPRVLDDLTRLRPWSSNSILPVHSPPQCPLQLGSQGQLRDHLALLFTGHKSLTHQPTVFHSTEAVLDFEESGLFGTSDRWVGGNNSIGRKPSGISLRLQIEKYQQNVPLYWRLQSGAVQNRTGYKAGNQQSLAWTIQASEASR